MFKHSIKLETLFCLPNSLDLVKYGITYSHIYQEQNVGDTFTQMLQIIPFDSSENTQIISNNLDNLQCIPVKKDS